MNPNAGHSAPLDGHETQDANVKWVVAVVVFLFVFGLCVHFILGKFLSLLERVPPSSDLWEPERRAATPPPARPAFPLLQVSPPLDLSEFRNRENQELESYGWIDRRRGIVRVPIERAMDLVLREGLPARKSVKNNPTAGSESDLSRDRLNRRQPEIQGGYR